MLNDMEITIDYSWPKRLTIEKNGVLISKGNIITLREYDMLYHKRDPAWDCYVDDAVVYTALYQGKLVEFSELSIRSIRRCNPT